MIRGSRRRWLLPGLAAAMIAAGAGLVACGATTPRATVSPVPSSVSTSPPPLPAPAVTKTVTVPRSVPVSIRIPAIGVSAPVMQLGLNADKTIQVPPLANANLAGWYKYGPSPGQPGPAVIVGHIDSAASGGEVFYRLRDMTKGQLIYVTLADGKTETFAVYGLQQAPKTDFPTARVYGHTRDAELRLVTCGGTFNPAAGSYESNIIVYAHLV